MVASFGMNLDAQMRQTQSMQLTFSQKLSLEILQLGIQNLEAKIQEELESNPLLEQKEASTESIADGDTDSPSGEHELTSEQEKEHLEAMMDAFEPILGEHNDVRRSTGDDDFDPLTLVEDNIADFEVSMEEQIHFLNPPPELLPAIETLLDHLDEKGYLLEPLESFWETEGAPQPKEWIKALRFIQEELEPPGLGAMDLQECLLIQVRRLGKGFDLERELLEEHFQELLERKVDRLSKALDIDEERLKDVLDFLKTLSFRPAAIFERKESGTLTPDATIKYDQPDALHPDGRFRILLSKRGTPELEVIPGTEYRSDSMTKEEKQYLSTQSSSAKALIEAIRRRNDTLQLTIAAICQRQVAFFEEGKSGLVPLQMQEIAQDLGMSAATVTRTVKDKVVQTDHGTFELRYFFSLKKVIMGNGMVADRDDLLNALKVVIEKEDKKKPLSDSAISKALKEKGHKVAIRTVSKYRDILGLPSSTKRKII